MMMRFALNQTNNAQLDFYTASSMKQQSVQSCCTTLTYYPDSEPTSLCSFSLMLCAQWRSNKYQFYSLWFDLIGLELTIYRTRGEHANHYVNDAVNTGFDILIHIRYHLLIHSSIVWVFFGALQTFSNAFFKMYE